MSISTSVNGSVSAPGTAAVDGPLVQHALAVLGPHTDVREFATESFVGLGGDSLAALRLVALVQERAGVRIPVGELLRGAPLAQVLAEAGAGRPTAPGDTAEGGQEAGLSPAQRGMWLVQRLTGGSPYNLVFSGVVEAGRLDVGTFCRAVTATVARHSTLRTVYREVGDDVRAEVLSDHVPQVTVLDCGEQVADFDGWVRAVAAEQGRVPFDLAAAPGLRFLHLSGPGGRQAVVLLAHHLVLDGRAVGLLLTELLTRHDALATGRPAPSTDPGPGMAALRRHQEGARAAGVWDAQAGFWAEHLAGVPSVLELPGDPARPALQDPAGRRIPVDLDAAASAAVTRQARELGITPFAVLLAAFGLTLSRWTGARSLLVGVPLLGRGTAELDRLIAVAGNLVPVRVDVDDDLSVADYLRAVARSLAGSIDAGDLPFEELVSRLGVERALDRHPLVQACFGMHDQLVPGRIRTGTADVRIEEGHGGGAQFDLSLLIGRSDPALAGHLEYATGVWHEAEAAGFVADLIAAAEQLAGPGATALEDVRCLPAERRAVLERLNLTRSSFPHTSLDQLFRGVVARTPDAVAVREGDLTLSYAQLLAAALRQAQLLREAGVAPGDRVLIGLERSVAEVVAVLGIVAAGAAYVGVDLGQPAAHLAQIVSRATPAAALVPAGSVPALAPHGIPAVGTWRPDWPLDGRPGAAEPWPDTDPARVAYVAFTSGSTGRPKGVSVPHRAVIRLVHEADYVRLGPGERMLRLSPLAFDASTLELWGPLVSGGAIEVHPAGMPSPSELGRFLRERGVTVAWLTAGLFRLVEEFASDSLGGLRQLLTGGDVVPHEHATRLLARHPGLVLTNGYGPTENTTFTATHSVASAGEIDGPLPIGRPVPGTRVYVLDDRRRLVPPGAVGELYAAGAGLADGYLGDEAETARGFGRFSPDVPERLYRTGDLVRLDSRGRLRFLGRRDDQVKLRGYRVELSAITDALTAHPAVHDAVATVTDGDSAEKRLLAAVVPAAGGVDLRELRDHLAQRLPSYMVPAWWAVVDRIPLTGNGKVDRRALAAQAAPTGQAPRTPARHRPAAGTGDLDRISALFAEAIAARSAGAGPEFGSDTDFFTAGGDSMAAVRLVRLVRDRLGVTVPLREFLRTPTPAGMLRAIRQG